MFDPYFIGDVDRKDIRVLESRGDRQFQILRVVLKLQDYYHVLLLKPNQDAERDQIVIDRLKHVFNLTPTHCFGLRLDFVYSNGKLYNFPWIEYVAMKSTFKGVELPHLEDVNFTSSELQIQALMILMFRFVVGAVGNCNEHILISDGKLMSISEGRFTSADMCADFASQFDHYDNHVWNEAKGRFFRGALLDNVRGVVLQVDHPTSDIRTKSPKGKLSISVRRIMISIEYRMDLLRSESLDVIKRALHVKYYNQNLLTSTRSEVE